MKTTKTRLLFSLFCKKCRKKFGINKNYIGAVTCPYCGKYIEG